MRFGVSLLNLRPGTAGGIETYMRKLVEHTPLCRRQDQVVYFVHQGNRNLVEGHVEHVVLRRPEPLISLCRIAEAFSPWHDKTLENLVASQSLDAMLYPQQSMYPKSNPIPTVLLVADVQYLFFPKRYSWLDLMFRKFAYLASLRRCSAIASISQITADHLVAHCGISPDKITVLHLGVDPPEPADPAIPSPFPHPYLFYPAASFPHKGHARLIRSYATLKRQNHIHQSLVFTGMQTRYWKVLDRLIRQEGMAKDITHLGYVSYERVKALYGAADAVLFPSEFEGFGIPVLEAAQLSRKLICSTVPVFRELGVPPQWQIDFDQPEALLHALAQDGPTRLERNPSTWEEVTRNTFNLLRKVATASAG